MEYRTINVKGIDFDVHYEFSSENDPLGTGDSPTAYMVDIIAIETTDDPKNLYDYLADWVIESIENEIIRIEAN